MVRVSLVLAFCVVLASLASPVLAQRETTVQPNIEAKPTLESNPIQSTISPSSSPSSSPPSSSSSPSSLSQPFTTRIQQTFARLAQDAARAAAVRDAEMADLVRRMNQAHMAMAWQMRENESGNPNGGEVRQRRGGGGEGSEYSQATELRREELEEMLKRQREANPQLSLGNPDVMPAIREHASNVYSRYSQAAATPASNVREALAPLNPYTHSIRVPLRGGSRGELSSGQGIEMQVPMSMPVSNLEETRATESTSNPTPIRQGSGVPLQGTPEIERRH